MPDIRRVGTPAWWAIGLVTLALHGCVLDAVWPASTALEANPLPVHIRTIAAQRPAPTAVQPTPSVDTGQADRTRLQRRRSQAPAATLPVPTRSMLADGHELVDRSPPSRTRPELQLVAMESDAPVSVETSEAAASADTPSPTSPTSPTSPPAVPLTVPTYRTDPPPATHLAYDLRHGMLSGQGDIDWAPSGSRYTLKLEGRIASLSLLTQISTGGFDAHGLAPERYTDQRMKRAANAANLQRDAGKITFSGSGNDYPLLAGTQDRVSWMVQLAAVINARPEFTKPGAKVSLFVVGARGEGDVWVFVCTGSETVDTGMGPMRADKFIREPTKPNDTQVEAWLAPQLHGLPAHARLSNGNDGALDLILRRVN